MDVEASLLKKLVEQIQTVSRLVTEAQGMREAERGDKLAEAGRVECAALNDILKDGGLLQLLRWQLEDPEVRPIALPLARPRVEELARLLRDPVLTELLEALGYQPPPPTEDLIDVVSETLRQVTGPMRGEAGATFDSVEVAMEQFRDAVCDLASTTQSAQDRQERVNRGIAMLVALLLAAVVTPGLQGAVRMASPQALRLIHAVVDRAGQAFDELSIAAVSGAAWIATTDSDFAREIEQTPHAADDSRDADSPSRHDQFVREVRNAGEDSAQEEPDGLGTEGTRTRDQLRTSSINPPYWRDAIDPGSKDTRDDPGRDYRGDR
jgi:hypothetical protein